MDDLSNPMAWIGIIILVAWAVFIVFLPFIIFGMASTLKRIEAQLVKSNQRRVEQPVISASD